MRRKEYRVVWFRQGRPFKLYDGATIKTPKPTRHTRKYASRKYAENLVAILTGKGGQLYQERYGNDGTSDEDHGVRQAWWCKEWKRTEDPPHCETMSEHYAELAERFDPLVGEPVIEERWAEYGPWNANGDSDG